MKTWDIDDKVDAAYEMRMEQVNHTIRTGGAASGGLTVRDYFAAKAMQALVGEGYAYNDDEYWPDISRCSYAMADAMLRERDRREPETMTVEEAFGL